MKYIYIIKSKYKNWDQFSLQWMISPLPVGYQLGWDFVSPAVCFQEQTGLKNIILKERMKNKTLVWVNKILVCVSW